MEASNIKKALRTHRMENVKCKIDFTDISTFDIVPTPPKGPKPEAVRPQRRHRSHAHKINTYEAKYGCSQDSETQKTQYDAGDGSGDSLKTVDPAYPWYCPTPRTGDSSLDRERKAIHKQTTCNALETTSKDRSTNSSRKQPVNDNPIRYLAPGPREQLAPSPFPVNKNKLAPVVDPRKNAVPKSARDGPRPVKAKHITVHKENVKTKVTDQPTRLSLPEAVYNTNPIRYPAPGPREQLAPSPFPVNKNKLAPVVDPRKNAVPKSARAGPRPVKAVHIPVYYENTDSSCMLTQMYGYRDDNVIDNVIPMKNSRPIRNPSPESRDQLLPSICPANRSRRSPLVKRGRVIAPMCG